MDLAQKSFDGFVDAHVAELLRTACLITWDDAEAEDLVQECLLRVARRWPRVSHMEMPVAYARRILINLALAGSGRRSRRRSELRALRSGRDDEAEFDIEHGTEVPDSADLRAELDLLAVGERSELLHALGRISPQQRTVLVLRYFLDQSEEQVAQALGCSIGTVKSSASRGLVRLREIVGPSFSHSPSEVPEP